MSSQVVCGAMLMLVVLGTQGVTSYQGFYNYYSQQQQQQQQQKVYGGNMNTNALYTKNTIDSYQPPSPSHDADNSHYGSRYSSPRGEQPGDGCAVRGLCCEEKNNTCMGSGPRVNDPHSESCFCDSSCRLLGDCCTDYDQYCRAIDCEVGGWYAWGPCDTTCGWGHKHRRREVVVYPRNGGESCGVTTEKQRCYGWTCKVQRHAFSLQELRETAKIIPARYGGHRKSKTYSPFEDIRKNLFHHYSGNEIIKRPAYCARFEVTSTRNSCMASPSHWASRLLQGDRVCVECQPYAMKKRLGVRCKGHGVYMKETRWTAMTVHGCHGTWKMVEKHTECRCNPREQLSVILV